MSLQNVILPGYVIASLYADCLVAGNTDQVHRGAEATLPEGSTRAQVANEKPYRFLGKNNKQVVVIAGYEGDPYMPEDHLEFLVKILAACKLNLGDVAILNYHEAGIEIGKLKSELSPTQVLLFGIEPSQIGLPLSFPQFKPQLFNGTNYLAIPPISEINQESEVARSGKKQLWECLKKIFLS